MAKLAGCMWCVVKRLLQFLAFALVVIYLPGLPPKGNFTASKVVPSEPLAGKYALNSILNNAEHLYVDKVKGPECLVEWNNELYTSVHGGEVVKLLPNDKVVSVAKVGKPCDGFWQESKCGRPLGFEIDKSGNLYMVDAYYGIWKVNIPSGKKQILISPDVEIEGRKPKLFNSLALASNGDLYWTDSSSEISIEDGVFGMLLDGSGRLFHYDAAKGKSRVLLDGLWFANGVALSPNEDFVVVSETARSQLRRYYLKGEKKGTDDIFIDGIPGLPDNLKADSKGIFVPLVSPRDEQHPVIFQSLAPHPLIRKFLARVLSLIQLPFETAQRILPHYVFERACHWIGHFESVQAIVPKRTGILRLDWSGNVVSTWYNTDGTLTGISEVIIYKNDLYLGSPYNNYVGRVSLSSSTEEMKKAQVKPQEVPKPTQPPTTTQRPTQAPTTTQRPTQAPTTTQRPTQAPTTTQRPTQAPTTTPKPTQAPTTTPKPTQAPTTTPKPTQAPTTTQKPTQAPTTTQKPTQAPTATPKPTPAPAVKPKPAKAAEPEKPKPASEKPKKEAEPAKPKPIAEEIPADTKPPRKEKIKVIKKEGPSEIPHPNKNEL